MHKYSVGDLVWVRVGDREPFQTTVLERLVRNGSFMYKIEWSVAGFNRLLNAVAISERALNEQGP